MPPTCTTNPPPPVPFSDAKTKKAEAAEEEAARKRLLEAEVAHLEQPRRIEQLARMMQLKPIAPDREITEDALIDVARRRELPKAAVSAEPIPPEAVAADAPEPRPDDAAVPAAPTPGAPR